MKAKVKNVDPSSNGQRAEMFTISADLLENIIKYLQSMPYNQVAGLLSEVMKTCKPADIIEEKTEK